MKKNKEDSVKFIGAFGMVELTYVGFQYDHNDRVRGEISPHFVATLYCNGEGSQPHIAKGITKENALTNVYTAYARYRAIEDIEKLKPRKGRVKIKRKIKNEE